MARPLTAAQVLARLARLRDTIENTEDRLEGLYAKRAAVYQAGRAVDPATGKPRVIFSAMAQAAGVSEEAIHKALRSARRKDDAETATPG